MKGLNFKHRISIYGRIEYENAAGETSTKFSKITDLWADIRTLNGKDHAIAIVEEKRVTYRFIIRHTKTVDAFQEIHYEGRKFKIDSLLNDNENNKTMTIIATAIL